MWDCLYCEIAGGGTDCPVSYVSVYVLPRASNPESRPYPTQPHHHHHPTRRCRRRSRPHSKIHLLFSEIRPFTVNGVENYMLPLTNLINSFGFLAVEKFQCGSGSAVTYSIYSVRPRTRIRGYLYLGFMDSGVNVA